MKNHPFQIPNFNTERVESQTRRLLDATKLSRLPSLPRRVLCENCHSMINGRDEFSTAVKLCKSCLGNYANVAAILEKHTVAKIRRNYSEGK